MKRLLLVIRHAIWMWRVLSLPKNRSKGCWLGDPVGKHLESAYVEMAELDEAVRRFTFRPSQETYRRVASEAADVSAFLAMLTDVCRRQVGE